MTLCYRRGEKRQEQLSQAADGILWGQWFPASAKAYRVIKFKLPYQHALLGKGNSSSSVAAFTVPGSLLFLLLLQNMSP